MSLSTFLLFCLLVISSIAYYHRKRRRFYKVIADIPGPQVIPLLGNLNIFIRLRQTEILPLLAYCAKLYDRFFRLWLGPQCVVCISQPEHIEAVLNSDNIEKAENYQVLKMALGDGLITAPAIKWKRYRKAISHSFHTTNLKDFLPIFHQEGVEMVRKLEAEVGEKEFDVIPYLREAFLGSILESSLDPALSTDKEFARKFIRFVSWVTHALGSRVHSPWLYPDSIFYLTRLGAEAKRRTDEIKQELMKKIKTIKENWQASPGEVTDKKKFVRLILEENAVDGEPLSVEEITSQIITITIAGFETSSSVIGFMLMMLGMHQDVQTKVYEEVMALAEELGGKTPQLHDLNKLQYTECVIKETLRRFPTVPLIGRKLSEEIKIDKYTLPKDTTIIMLLFYTYMDPKIWKDPELFNPDRFTTASVAERHPCSFLPFSIGSRNCIGYRYAMTAMKIKVMEIIKKFQIECEGNPEDIKLTFDITLQSVGGWKIKLKQR